MLQSVWAAIAKGQGLGSFNNRHLLLPVTETVIQGQGADNHLLSVPSHGREANSRSPPLLIRASIPTQVFCLMTSCKPNYYSRLPPHPKALTNSS